MYKQRLPKGAAVFLWGCTFRITGSAVIQIVNCITVMSNELQNIKTYYPRDPHLASCIQYYYFMRSGREFNTAYFVFPNTNISLTIHKNISYTIAERSIAVSGSDENNHVALVQGMRELPVYVSLEGELDKLTIVFHPLGLNHFIQDTYLAVAAKETQLCSTWDDKAQYTAFIKAFYLK